MKRIIIGTVAVMMTVPCFAAGGDNVLTSKPYVDDAVSTRQDKIPAANPSNTNLGETVMTYTGTEGEIGERELFTGGTYDATTDGDKLITASALKSAFTLPETQTTKLVCANQSEGCTLWTITNQTAYGKIDLISIMGMSAGTDSASRSNSGFGDNSSNAATYGVTQNGTWVVDYGNGKRIRGKSQCSTRAGDTHTWDLDNDTYNTISSNFTPTLPDASGGNCYCQLDGYTTNGDNWGNMTALSAPWVFMFDAGDAYYCASYCAGECAYGLLNDDLARTLAFRAAMFNSVQ